MRHVIESVERGSVAYRHGLRAGDVLVSLDGEPVVDEIDYQALIAGSRVRAVVERGGEERTVDIRKQEGEPLGLHFGEEMALSPRTCRNDCVFCFIRQMPPGLRKTLYVRDDDWRFSLMMGNFVTLTNVDDAEFDRIIRRHASPLYVSVHATDPALRCRMMNNRFAGDILQRLTRLKDAGIRFHCQIVVCPGWNDGEQLLKTLSDLRALAPAAQTAAMVPVGLTRFREGLEPLRPFTKAEAEALLDAIAPFQEQCRRELGTTFAFPSDEFFCIAGRPIPPESWYEDFPQIENGVGLLRRFECELEEAERFDLPGETPPAKRYLIPTGVSAAPHLAAHGGALRAAGGERAGAAGQKPLLWRDGHGDGPAHRGRRAFRPHARSGGGCGRAAPVLGHAAPRGRSVSGRHAHRRVPQARAATPAS